MLSINSVLASRFIERESCLVGAAAATSVGLKATVWSNYCVPSTKENEMSGPKRENNSLRENLVHRRDHHQFLLVVGCHLPCKRYWWLCWSQSATNSPTSINNILWCRKPGSPRPKKDDRLLPSHNNHLQSSTGAAAKTKVNPPTGHVSFEVCILLHDTARKHTRVALAFATFLGVQ